VPRNRSILKQNAVLAAGYAPSRLDMLQIGLPDQGTIGDQPSVWPARMRGNQALYEGVVVLVGV
jgi:hypothetical protein